MVLKLFFNQKIKFGGELGFANDALQVLGEKISVTMTYKQDRLQTSLENIN